MECYSHCQSCGMPMDDPEHFGTEKDGTKSTIYCIHCYRNGVFTHPDMTLEEMEAHIKERMKVFSCKQHEIDRALAHLPHLLRWILVPTCRHYDSPINDRHWKLS